MPPRRELTAGEWAECKALLGWMVEDHQERIEALEAWQARMTVLLAKIAGGIVVLTALVTMGWQILKHLTSH